MTFLEDGQAALIGADGVSLYDVTSGRRAGQARVWDNSRQDEHGGLDGHRHYMTKEILEQPRVLRRLAAQRAADAQQLADEVRSAGTVHLVGCGSAAPDARCGEYLFSRIAARQVNCVVGSECGYMEDFLDRRSLVVGLSQSGKRSTCWSR